MNPLLDRLDALHRCLDDSAAAAVAVSGGVDSMTLAFIAHRRLGERVSMFHAVSPAVPAAATERVKAYAEREGWALFVLDAGEFADERYMANPANRCFFCKTNLYGTLAARTSDQLLSGTNLDDLGDWRPGLKAAEAEGVRHPFVEAGIDKSSVRRLAAHFALSDLAELPAAPCLSSRIETGLRIDALLLPGIDRVETLLRERLSPETVRCRLRKGGVVIELDQATFDRLDASGRQALTSEIATILDAAAAGGIDFEPYRRGSAFLRENAEAAS
ncbi:MAG: adenine nucleotide alpha hydrolase [Alphaproteobacteria bacterium]|nr:adenine nucleotide alpha hydrolase [Alphaproteobacteria bacterium]